MIVSDHTVNLVEERIDLAVRLSNRIDPGLVARKLAVCKSVICASPAYLRVAGVPTSPADLANHRCIAHSTAFAPEYRFHLNGQVTVIPVHSTLRSNETSIVHGAAVAGGGIAMLPTYYVGTDLADGVLIRLLPHFALDNLEIQAVYLSRRHQPRPLRLLVDFLQTRFGGDTAPWDRDTVAAHVSGKSAPA